MATRVYLRQLYSSVDAATGDGYKLARTTRGSSSTSIVINPANGSNNSVWTLTSGGSVTAWITEALEAQTISGTTTFNFWALESQVQLDAYASVELFKLPRGSTTETSIFGPVRDDVEIGAASSALNWSGTLASTSFNKGDRIVIKALCAGAPSVTNGGAGSRTATLFYDGATADAEGDSWVDFPDLIFQQRNISGT